MSRLLASTAGRSPLRWLPLLAAASYILAAGYVVARRFNFPFELEWMEGGSLVQVLRILHGQPLYTPPSLEYVPYIYPPLYFYVSAMMAWLTGIHWFSSLRLVSIAATLATGFLIYRLVYLETASHYWAFISAGLFGAAFRESGFWFDIARVDMLFTFLFLAGTYALTRPGRFHFALAGALFALAFYTKQTMAGPAVAIFVYLLLLRRWRSACELGITFAGISAVLFFIENSRSDGWYSFYVFYLPSLHRFFEPAWVALFVAASKIAGILLIALPLAFLPLVTQPGKALQSSHRQLAFVVLLALAISWIGLAQPGGAKNTILPALATVPILAGLGGAWLESQREARMPKVVLPVSYFLLLLQFVYLGFDVSGHIPTQEEARAGKQLVASMAATPGEVLAPYHSYLLLMAGKRPSAHQVTLWELSGKFGEPAAATWASLGAEISHALASQRYQRIFLERLDKVWEEVPLYYRESGRRYVVPSAYNPVSEPLPPLSLEFVPK
jgi:glycosyl transferase family 87